MHNERPPEATEPRTADLTTSNNHRPSIFSSFWMGGFESSTHINRHGHRLDMIAATQHDRFAEEDYSRLRQMGITAVRDTVLTIRRRKGMVIEEGNPANHSVGSFFVNPVVTTEHLARLDRQVAGMPRYRVDDGHVKIPAAWLIERAGFEKGTRRGSVGVSPFQAQAIINLGAATAADIVSLASDIKCAVWTAFEVALVPEPVFVGFQPSPELRRLLDPEPRG